MIELLFKEFRKRFRNDAPQLFFCPGRVNLIGEHIDYNGGQVMPCAISKGTYLAIAKNTDKKIRFSSFDFPDKAELQIQTSYSKTGKQWFNYPLGVLDYLIRNGNELSGLDMLFAGDLPVGAGLSSSASIEVLTIYALDELFGYNRSKTEMALAAKKVENDFIGVSCGIMDQFAVAMGQKNKAILLNCDTLKYEYIPFETKGYSLVIINTNKQRALSESKYNERFAECGAVLKSLKKELQIEKLCDIDPGAFEKYKHLTGSEVLVKRARHVITENERVAKASSALKSGNISMFGSLMFDSHQSLKEWYEVSGIELDTIVEFARSYNECIGARMTGAGFGGCAIALVQKEYVNDFEEKLISFYKSRIGYEASVFISGAEDGVRSLKV
ncbi:MAG: galactokinase [Chitinophagaceae bacterium]|jgi:galactokinase|nr:galactokinase [Chitinophagaceae bacterium]OQY93616.1 MAG: galactokinase [Sphingobacteriales bacterium UTBCD1]